MNECIYDLKVKASTLQTIIDAIRAVPMPYNMSDPILKDLAAQAEPQSAAWLKAHEEAPNPSARAKK
jgi:hypothetical protein